MTDTVKSWIEERRVIHESAAEAPWWTTRDLQPATVFSGDGSADDIAVLTTFEHSDATAVVDAHNNLPRALDALNAVLGLCDEWDREVSIPGVPGVECDESFKVRLVIQKAIEGALNDE